MVEGPGRRRARSRGSGSPALSRFPRPGLGAFPTLPALVAAAIAGLVCGLLAVGLVLFGERGCDAVQGRPSCGGVGLLMLIGIVVACLVVGALILTALRVDDPTVVAFFGVSLPLLIVMLFLMDEVFSGWMLVVIPLLVATCFALSSVLTRVLENSREPAYDVAAYPPTSPDVPVTQHKTDPLSHDAPIDLPRYAPTDDTVPMSGRGATTYDDPTLLTASRGASSTMGSHHDLPASPPPDDIDMLLGPSDPPDERPADLT